MKNIIDIGIERKALQPLQLNLLEKAHHVTLDKLPWAALRLNHRYGVSAPAALAIANCAGFDVEGGAR